MYQVFCKDPFNIKSKFIGEFNSLPEAKEVYIKTKTKYLEDLKDKGYLDNELFNIIVTNFISEG